MCDSCGLALIRPLAAGIEKVYCSYALHSDSHTKQQLEERIENDKSDAVLFVACPSNYGTFCERNPRFFE